MTITKIKLFSVPVTDQESSKLFYVDVLGFDVVRDNPMGPDQRWVEVAPKGGDTTITLVTGFPTMPAGSTKGIVIETDDLERDVDELHSRGVEFQGEIQEAPWARFATFDDPDGNGFVLQERLQDDV